MVPDTRPASIESAFRVPSIHLLPQWRVEYWREENTHLSFRKSPKVDSHANQIVQSGIRALVQQQCGKCRERVQHQSCFDAAVYRRAGDEPERPLPGQTDESEYHVHNLEDGNGLHGGVEVLGEEVPEDFGPEEAFEGGGDLVCEGDGLAMGIEEVMLGM